ncbi:hypothetical protein POPTR_004G000750v4 [Populus trichocarpa]|uniref:Uncharacterized protein n=1 Tax=Populus trichocarpa TaxID=3694 RepID=A0ACC0T282_POPTR|nr:guanine nucleotide exchange factor SPIKE 1-like [Populus trichocarpa]KAI9395597.1 hypothetical protein POPTR_004G000750v4 [Populus trichocarpa]
MIETRTAALQNELEEPRSSEGDQLPRLQSLQRILQGNVAVQVNSGVLSVCTAFLSGEPAARLSLQELQQLIAALLEFMAVCKRAIRVHFRLIGEEGQDFVLFGCTTAFEWISVPHCSVISLHPRHSC